MGVLLHSKPFNLQFLTCVLVSLFKGVTFILLLKRMISLSSQLLLKPLLSGTPASSPSCLSSLHSSPSPSLPSLLPLPASFQPSPSLPALHSRPCPLPRPGGTND